jgi:hypothetical protein
MACIVQKLLGYHDPREASPSFVSTTLMAYLRNKRISDSRLYSGYPRALEADYMEIISTPRALK